MSLAVIERTTALRSATVGTVTGRSAGERAFNEATVDRIPGAVTGVRGGLACRTFDADLWFSEAPADLEMAKSLCVDCPMRIACLAGALDRAEPWGVWGGEIFERGAVVARKRPRGRPRKDDLAREAAARVQTKERIDALMSAAVVA